MALEMKKAKFVIPMQIDESKAKGDNKKKNGTYKFNKDAKNVPSLAANLLKKMENKEAVIY